LGGFKFNFIIFKTVVKIKSFNLKFYYFFPSPQPGKRSKEMPYQHRAEIRAEPGMVRIQAQTMR